MLRIGISGGLASGKSMFCSIWEELGARVLNADDFAKRLMVEHEPLKEAIIQAFGEDSYMTNGALNREYLAEQAFELDRVEQLNNLVHPEVRKQVQQEMDDAEKEGVAIFLYEAALLLKEGRPSYLDKVIWIEADREKQIQRALKRSNLSLNEAKKRLEYQSKLENIKVWVDYIIYNNTDKHAFRLEAIQLFEQFV